MENNRLTVFQLLDASLVSSTVQLEDCEALEAKADGLQAPSTFSATALARTVS
jgi:hypothetical protein